MAASFFLAALLVFFFISDAVADPESPALYACVFHTDAGHSFTVDVNRSLAPLGADRIFAAVGDGFYDNSAFFRVVPGFVVQFGISGDKALNDKWLHSSIQDDPVLGSNLPGTVTFASAGPNTRTTQLFVNEVDNSRLDSQGFAPFGVVRGTGLDVVKGLFNPTPGNSGGIDQYAYEERGNDWVRSTYPGTNFIVKASCALSVGFATHALWFLLLAVANMALLALTARRWYIGRQCSHRFEWQGSRVLIAAGLFGTTWDCLRYFAGGFWAGLSDPPTFAYSIYPLMLLHLVLVPLLITVCAEFVIAAHSGDLRDGDSRGWQRVRWVAVLISLILAAMGAVNASSRMAATDALVWVEHSGNLVVWTLTELEGARALGYPVAGPELVGVVTFAFVALLSGVCVARKVKYYAYGALSLVAVVGQSIAGPLGPRTFVSNLFEVVSFAALLCADCRLFMHAATASHQVLQNDSGLVVLGLSKSIEKEGLGRVVSEDDRALDDATCNLVCA